MTATQSKTGAFELQRGTTVGKYEILRKLASGGMAEIYLARSRGTAGFEKLVVLKRILPSVAEDPVFVSLFLDEARLAATLQHPNIGDVYDVGEADGTYFFTMEYVHGQDVRTIRMATRKRNEPVPLAIALAIVHGTASALDYAHDKRGPDGTPLGLVHRDVSASNVIVSYDGAIKLVDFGIARATSSRHKTQTGTLKGKIPYMSPEQARGLPMDRRSDLFSLGVILYELTVGRRPFRGDTDFAIMDQIVYHGAQAPSEVAPGYPEELEVIVMKMLQRAPSERYASCEEVIHAIEELIGQHRLWVSAKPLGKYMRGLFADRIAAWEQAERDGMSFIQHVAESITSQSQRSELVTPPSAFPALPPRTSQELVAEEQPRISQPMAAVSAPPEYPLLVERSRRGLWIAAGLIVLCVGSVGGYLWLQDSPSNVAKPPTDEPSIHMTVTEPAPQLPPAPALVPAHERVAPAPAPIREVDPVPHVAAKTPAKPTAPPTRRTVRAPPRQNSKVTAKPNPDPEPKPKEPTWDPDSPILQP